MKEFFGIALDKSQIKYIQKIRKNYKKEDFPEELQKLWKIIKSLSKSVHQRQKIMDPYREKVLELPNKFSITRILRKSELPSARLFTSFVVITDQKGEGYDRLKEATSLIEHRLFRKVKELIDIEVKTKEEFEVLSSLSRPSKDRKVKIIYSIQQDK